MFESILGILGSLGGLFGGNKKQTQHESWNEWKENWSKADSQDLSPELLKSLEGLFMKQMNSGQFESGTNAIQGRLEQLMKQSQDPQFDVDKYASGIRDQATSAAQLDLESGINSMLSQAGVSEGGNSMNALMANKMRNTTAANLGGVFSQAYGEGEQIRQAQQGQLTEGIQGLGGSLVESMLGLIGATRGASQTGKSQTLEHGWGKSTASTKGAQGIPDNDYLGDFFKNFFK
jgi:hypothetical protein